MGTKNKEARDEPGNAASDDELKAAKKHVSGALTLFMQAGIGCPMLASDPLYESIGEGLLQLKRRLEKATKCKPS